MPKALLLNTTMFCNARCPFCIVIDNLDKPELNMTDEQVEAALVQARAGGATDVGYSGGEPSIDPRFVEIVKRAKELGFTHQSLNTNGIRFKDAKFCRQVVEAGITSIDFSLHGHFAELHDELVAKKGAFDAIVQACEHLRALKAEGFQFHLSGTAVIARKNHVHLREIVEFMHGLGITNVRLKYAYEGNLSHDVIIQQVAPYQEVVPSVVAALDHLAGKRGGFHVTHVPLCLLGDHAAFSSDYEIRHAQMSSAKETVFGEAGQYFRQDGDACAGCALHNLCTRLDGGYQKFHGTPELKPFATPDEVEAMFDRADARFPLSKNHVKRMRETYRRNKDAAMPESIVAGPSAAHPGTPVKLSVKRGPAPDAAGTK